MLQELVLFAGIAVALSTLFVVLPGVSRAPLWIGVPLAVVSLGAAGWVTSQLTGDQLAGIVFPLVGLVLVGGSRVWLLKRWSLPAVQLFTLLIAGSALYIAFAAVLTVEQPLAPVGWVGSVLLLLLEVLALSLSVSYAFELLDVMGRKDRPYRKADPAHRPTVAIQVPAYNEPLEVVEQTLRSLAELRYDRLLVQVVDNNTPDEKVWKPLEALCRQLGERFEFMHLENWPGYKAGALNEATRRLAPEYEVIGIVDADYVVKPDFLEELVGLFADPKVAFVQSSQNYRDWTDDGYLRGLFYSYRYFFDVSMPSRAQRNAIIFAGTMGLIRRSALDEIGGWNPDCVTEDAEASLRLLGRGYSGIYDRSPRGEGLMPLSFDGLKKQRFRWALGGIQMLRMHWRELLPLGAHKLKLSTAQRLHYLVASVQWFGEVVTLIFTLLLLLTAAFLAVHHTLPVRQLVGAVVVVPPLFLFTGLLRVLWGLRSTTGCGWRDALRALGVWLALSWVVALACMRGLVRSKAAFLRTPKRKEGTSTLGQALSSCKVESALAAASLIGAILIPLSALSPATAVLSLLLLYQAAFYASAPWASLAAEGVTLTEFRKIYKRSSQNTGDRPDAGIGVPLPVRAAAALAAVAVVGLLFSTAQPAPPPRQQDLPKLGQVAGAKKLAPTPPTIPSPAAAPSPSANGRNSRSPAPSPSSSP
jgi:cellulose synthase/poly-beta-1,6-N-acetylglucosamine synthase-like glycosyltransferase